MAGRRLTVTTDSQPARDARPARPVRISATAAIFKKRLKQKSEQDRQAVKDTLKQMERSIGSMTSGRPASMALSRTSDSAKL